MKLFKNAFRFTALSVLASSLILPATGIASTSTINQGDKNGLEAVIDNYFDFREHQVINPSSQRANKEIHPSATKSVELFEVQREQKYRQMEKKLDIKVVQAKGTTYMNKIEVNGDKATAYVYEWVTMDYKSPDNKLDYMGMGTWHSITFEKKNKNWKITDVSYDEGPLTEVTTPDIVRLQEQQNEKMPQMNGEPVNSTQLDKDDIMLHPSVKGQLVDNSTESTTMPYKRDGVVSYADRYVKPGAYGANYETYYNPAYKNFNPAGGDCANYVSQSMYEGGTLPMIGKAARSKANGAWWYDNRGTSSTSDDLVTENWSWTGAHYHRTHIGISYGTSTVNSPTATDIVKGNPVYYDWDGNGWYDHVTIAVGTNSSGVPVVNSHNKDYHRVKWNYGASGTKYSTVKIVNYYEVPPYAPL
ncbi:MAG TPA: amidase domain-containing protein [Bacillaceae bacterium]